MKIKNKFLKTLVWIASIAVCLAIVIALGSYSFLQFYLLPKLNANNALDESKISVSDIAKFGDKQIISNILNFDRSSASEMIGIIDELDQEVNPEGNEADGEEVPENTAPEKDNNQNTSSGKPEEKPVSKGGSTAYERIMNEATKEEIAQGAAIMSKISMSKVNELRSSGDVVALKAYIKSALSSSEISTALKLYNKYKHLL